MHCSVKRCGKRRAVLALIVLCPGTMAGFLHACGSGAPLRQPAPAVEERGRIEQPFVPGEVLVKFKPGVSPERIAAILRETGTELIVEIKGSGVRHLRIVRTQAVESAVKQLSGFQEVEYAEPNFIFQAQ